MNSAKQLDCLFIFSPGSGESRNNFHYSIGSAYIISYLNHHGFSAQQFICNFTVNLEQVVKMILSFKPKIIGFTVFDTNFNPSILIARRIKEISDKTIVVFGGPCTTSHSEFIIGKYPFIDVCFRNEGEEIFLQFMRFISEKQFDFHRIDLSQIKGITFRIGGKTIVNPESNILIDNFRIRDYLDSYPSPYLSGTIPGGEAFKTGIITARGCNQHCIYCNCAVLSKRRFLTHSIKRVLNDLDFISKFAGANDVLDIFDDAFSLIPERAKEICHGIIENKIKISLGCITRCDCVDEELLDLMKEAGFTSVGFSLESASPRILRRIGKVHRAEDSPTDDLAKETMFIEKLGEMTAYAKKIGIRTIFSSIMVGLPGETLAEARNTIEKVENNKALDFFTHNTLKIYKGTPLYTYCRNYGYKIELIDNNPVFSKTIYPDDNVYKINTSSKSHFWKWQRETINNTLMILSLLPGKRNEYRWFDNLILLSDTVTKSFVEWIRNILAINGTIIQIYSSRDALLQNSEINHEKYIRYTSPSLNINKYYREKSEGINMVCSYSPVFKSTNNSDIIKICDFKYYISNLSNHEVDFIKTICEESDQDDANLLFTYFKEKKEDKNLFTNFINSKPSPYFSGLCKWTNNHSNCRWRKTLIVNEKSELRLCWNGGIVGFVGHSFDTIIKNLEGDVRNAIRDRNCDNCVAKSRCIKCPSPFPISESDYCIRQKSGNINSVADLLISLDTIKQYA